jgi:hypothetical protein
MAANIIIPVDSSPYRSITMDLDGAFYFISTRWNFTDSAWYMDLESTDPAGVQILGMKLLVGHDFLSPFAITELGEMYIIDEQGAAQDPTEESLGDRHKLFYVLKENRGTFI